MQTLQSPLIRTIEVGDPILGTIKPDVTHTNINLHKVGLMVCAHFESGSLSKPMHKSETKVYGKTEELVIAKLKEYLN